MRYSIELRDIIYLKGYGFLSFAKNMGRNLKSFLIVLENLQQMQ